MTKIPLTRSQEYATEALILVIAFVGVFCVGLALIALSSP